MKEFGIRLYNTSVFVFKVFFTILLAVLAIGFVMAIVLHLPYFYLHSVYGEWAILWFVFILVVVTIIVFWKDLKGWFIWQFIEPFKKK